MSILDDMSEKDLNAFADSIKYRGLLKKGDKLHIPAGTVIRFLVYQGECVYTFLEDCDCCVNTVDRDEYNLHTVDWKPCLVKHKSPSIDDTYGVFNFWVMKEGSGIHKYKVQETDSNDVVSE